MTSLRKAKKELKEKGYVLKRRGANHDIYYNKEKKRTVPLKRHDFDEDDLIYLRKEM